MSRKARKAKNFVEEGLEKVRSKTWAEPLGKALGVSGKIVGVVEGLVPGANIIGGALSFGATLLNPAPTIEDLQKELRDIKELIKQSTSQAAVRALEREQRDLESKIAHPPEEIRREFGTIKVDTKQILKAIEKSSGLIVGDIAKMRDIVSRTYHIVADLKYKVLPLDKKIFTVLSRRELRRSMPLTKLSSKTASRTSRTMPLNSKRVLTKT